MDHIEHPPGRPVPTAVDGKKISKGITDGASDFGRAVGLLLRYTVDVLQAVLEEPYRFLKRLAPGSDDSKARGLAAAIRAIANQPSADDFFRTLVGSMVTERREAFELAAKIIKKIDSAKTVTFKTTGKSVTNASYKADILLLENKIDSKILGKTPAALRESIIAEMRDFLHETHTTKGAVQTDKLKEEIKKASARLASLDLDNLQKELYKQVDQSYEKNLSSYDNSDSLPVDTAGCGCYSSSDEDD